MIRTQEGITVNQAKLAVLIDADNAQAVCIDGLLDEVSKYGIASVKRIYGDWTSTHLRSWKDKLLEHAIQPIQQFSYTSGKNATDSAMIIDAMDLLYSEKLDGFCIVSSDSDFTRLAARIREGGLKVYGFGEQKTPPSFVSVCDKFVYTEILRDVKEDTVEEGITKATAKRKEPKVVDKKTFKMLTVAVESIADDSGWAYLGSVGQQIAKRSPVFDPRNYGFKKLGDLFRAEKGFEIDERQSENGVGKQVYIRVIK
ncbi:MAG: NYN domain-containing protein [Termitinemataceae bacterium]|nr:MAG: NYN domain-containing protein [Termitinemataceae bacterium]